MYHRMAKERLSAVGYFSTLGHLYSESVAAGLSGGAYFDVQDLKIFHQTDKLTDGQN